VVKILEAQPLSDPNPTFAGTRAADALWFDTPGCTKVKCSQNRRAICQDEV